MVQQQGQIWQVVGGVGKGGLIVRASRDLSSPELPGRLSVGALVCELEFENGRLEYKLVSGSGPQQGWVSTKTQDKPLLVATDDFFQESKVHRTPAQTNNGIEECSLLATQEAPGMELLTVYSGRFLQMSEQEIEEHAQLEASRRQQQQQRPAAARKIWSAADVRTQPGRPLHHLQNKNLPEHRRPNRQSVEERACYLGEDSDGEELVLCTDCALPLGFTAYGYNDSSEHCLHGECAAHRMMHDVQYDEEVRSREIHVLKKERHAEFCIGWKVEQIPRNIDCASTLCQFSIPRGMCCLVLHEPLSQQPSLHLRPTVEPAAAVNLEYLAIALQARRKDGRAPWFSLDPMGVSEESKTLDFHDRIMQRKVFEPAWLAATSVGEVMFQADYYLKELSMGELEQPVVGMRSTFDLEENDTERDKEWHAREWFVIRKANVQMSADGVLIPCVKMGVEAREQTLLYEGFDLIGMQDSRTTRSSHPMVKYAEQFTQYFDLIAERKSVIFHLREVAKATVLARYLLASKVRLDESWFALASASSKAYGPEEIPQLWHERYQQQIQVEDGAVAPTQKSTRHCAYGGVSLELRGPADPWHAFNLKGGLQGQEDIATGRRAPEQGQQDITTVLGSYGGSAPLVPMNQWIDDLVSGKPDSRTAAPAGAPTARVARKRMLNWPARKGGGMRLSQPQLARAPSLGFDPSVLSLATAPRLQLSQAAMPAIGAGLFTPGTNLRAPKGVDLNVEDCWVPDELGNWGNCLHSSECDLGPFAHQFWSNILGTESSPSVFKDDGKNLLQDIFNPHLSDRREEGKQFTPPGCSSSHVQKLIDLIQDEEDICQRRKERFFAEDFSRSKPGNQFPRSWESSVQVVNVHTQGKTGALVPYPDHHISAAGLQAVMPVFDKSTENGTRFRIYTLGALEVRTYQDNGEEEVIGAVFSMRARRGPLLERSWTSNGDEKVIKITVYVDRCSAGFCYYVVLESEASSIVVTELTQAGTVNWEWNPNYLEERNSTAKVLDVVNMQGRVSFADVKKSCCSSDSFPHNCANSQSARKRYAQLVYKCADVNNSLC